VITSFTLLAFLALYSIGLIYWHRKTTLRWQCLAATILAVAFTAYRPSGAIFFPIIAAFLPFSVDGRPLRSMMLVGLVAAILYVEWLLLGREIDSFLYVLVTFSLILGSGTAFNARQLLSNERLFRSAERERIARDLHDTLGQSLTAIAVKSELARHLLDKQAWMEARSEMADVERVSREALAEMRELVRNYYGGGVVAELQRAKSMLEAADIAIEQNCDLPEVSPAQERVLGLVIRESVTNVVRHAQASLCKLDIRREGDSIRFLMQDNGVGGTHHKGLGMQSIEARVEALGGNAVWDGSRGTVLSVILPLAFDGRKKD
jgi:two-component system sensor histidine kinase DesK